MLNAGVLSFDEFGRVKTTETIIALRFNGGTPICHGLLAVSALDPVTYNSGLAYTADGAACSEQPINATAGGNLFNTRGLVRSSTGMPAYWHAGLPFTADGKLSVISGDIAPPVEEHEFDRSSFSKAFK
jgi:hypothetical protein